MNITYNLVRQHIKRTLYLLALILLVGALFGNSRVHAIYENYRSIPDNFVDQIFRSRNDGFQQYKRGPYNAPGNNCVSGGHFGASWISPDSSQESETKKDLSQTNNILEVTEGTKNIALRLNAMGGVCDSGINTNSDPLKRTYNSKGRSLQTAYTNISDNPIVTVLNEDLNAPKITGINNGDVLAVNHAPAQNAQKRWVTRQDGLYIDVPFFKSFKLEGINELPSRPGVYRLQLVIPVKNVNYFPGGYGGDSGMKYVCVNGKTNAGDSKGDSCREGAIVARIYIRINPKFAADCSINITEPANRIITSGQVIEGTITVSNKGSNDWGVLYPPDEENEGKASFRLASTLDNDLWGPGTKRIAIKPSATGGFGPVLQAGKATDTPVTFKAPDGLPTGTQKLVYRVLLEGDGQPRSPYAICDTEFVVKENAPFLRVGGGDVVAGARFTGYKQDVADDLPVSYTSANATSAGIDTNGVDESFGSSSSRYAAFASGFINSLSGGQNAFYSNDFFERNNRKDLTFANKNVTGDKYGQFYGDTPPEGALPLVDVSALYDLAIKGSSANVNAALNSSDSTTVSENLTANTTNISGSKVVMVNGDLTIKNNIQYSAADTNLIVLVIGNIYIENAVTVLDGTYIAYPVDDNTGIVDTCSDFGSVGDWPTAGGSAPKIDSCPNKLTINGRLVASKVVWKRTRGTIGDASSTINSGGCLYASGGNSCAAEFIDFDPRAYFNSPLQPTEEGSVGNVPTSTLDLPPVY